jgi:fibronectin type 3 domain-containing protein
LAWDAVAATNLTGYRVYYGTTSGKYQQALGAGAWAGNVTSFNVTGLLTGGTTYYFVVTSVDSQGKESAFSNEASKLVN